MESKSADAGWAPAEFDKQPALELFVPGREIGSGAFGKVFEAKRRGSSSPDYPYVIKSINHRGNEESTRVLNQEVFAMRIVSSLMDDKPGNPANRFPRLYHAYREGSKCWLVMDNIRGGELFNFLSQNSKYSEADAAEAFKRVVEAVDFLHRHGITHRDMKPENLLLRDKGAVRDLVICDFGLCQIGVCHAPGCTSTYCTAARERGFGYKDPEFASPGRPVRPRGTLAYMSPEILTTNRYETPVSRPEYYEPYTRSDEWALGVVLYILVHGIPPFYDDPPTSMREMIITNSWQFWDDYYPVSEEVKSLISGLLVSQPQRRATCDTILRHVWFKAPPTVSKADLAERLAAFNRSREVRTRFTRTVDRLRMFKHLQLRNTKQRNLTKTGLTAAVVAQLRSHFFSSSGSAFTVDEAAFCALLDKAGFGFMATEYGPDLFTAFDTNEDGQVDFAEFLAGAALMCAEGSDTVKWLFQAYGGGSPLDEEGFAKVVYSLNPAAFANPDTDPAVDERLGRAMDLFNECADPDTQTVTFDAFMSGAKAHPELVAGLFDPNTGSCFGQILLRRAANDEPVRDRRPTGRKPPSLTRKNAMDEGKATAATAWAAIGGAAGAGSAGDGAAGAGLAGGGAGGGDTSTAAAIVTPSPAPPAVAADASTSSFTPLIIGAAAAAVLAIGAVVVIRAMRK